MSDGPWYIDVAYRQETEPNMPLTGVFGPIIDREYVDQALADLARRGDVISATVRRALPEHRED